jgi:hypothetical protein
MARDVMRGLLEQLSPEAKVEIVGGNGAYDSKLACAAVA